MPALLGGPEMLLMLLLMLGGLATGIYLAVRLARRAVPPKERS